MEYSEIITVIGQVGFPIAVATYTLIVLNKTIKENTQILIEMKTLINKMCGEKK